MTENKLIIGTAPDSWGVWFPDDPKQTPWERFLDEVAESGYKWIELGPYGYLPTDPARLAEELKARDLQISAGTVFTAFHRGLDQWETAWEPARKVAELTAAMGGEHIVVIPAMWRDDVTGEAVESGELSEKAWADLFAGHNRLGKTLLEDFGLKQQFHSHADSHVGAQEDIETLLAATDGQYLNLCLDTGHAEYCGASSLELIKNYPDRIGYLHLKQINPDILKKVNEENMTWAAANLAGVMTEPPNGLPDLRAVIEAVEALNRPDLWHRGAGHVPRGLRCARCRSPSAPATTCSPAAPAPPSTRRSTQNRRTRTMTKTLRVAVIGAGRMGADHIQRLNTRIHGAEVAAVVDVDLARAQAAIEGIPGAVALADADEALNNGDVNAVLIATPGFLHEDILLKAIAKDIPILCEKPLTPDAASAWKIVQAEEQLGRQRIQVGFMRRFDAEYAALGKIIRTPNSASC